MYLLWISYHLIALSDSIMSNEGIKILSNVCGVYLCTEAIKSVNSQ